ncbi:MAG: toxin-antitoxin system, antitoxin component, Xre family protein [Lachnospiraceae bacterium]|nr:toxin-antitoxin system, antitoxin component, Xre family protein [Lachnospiraceae bacterium]
MTNKELLEKAIEKSGIKVMKLMEAAGIKSYATFRGRMNNDTEFTASEIQALTDALQLTSSERDRIFFCPGS